jgi:glutamate synthase (NADPH/NADH) small chain
MGKITGFLEYPREAPPRRPIAERLRDWKEFEGKPSEDTLKAQGARCMDCGVPFCHNGCPLGNEIPDWNDLVYRGRWKEAIEALHATNNFPEFTGRICPAPCEEACVLGINADPVSIKLIEKNVIDHAWRAGYVRPQPPLVESGKKVAVVGSGPAGMACAQQLARAGHAVTLFERSDRIGGLLRYGIPDFKMEKHLIDRRMEQMEAEGVTFRTSVAVGSDITTDELKKEFDAVVLSVGATQARDLPVPGRELAGVHYAMEFLPQQNKRVAGDTVPGQIMASEKHVVVIGGGDTGSDCIGTSNRQGAASITQLEILPKPPSTRTPDMPWPYWPMIFRTSSSQEEGAERDFAVNTRRFIGENGKLKAMECVRVEWFTDDDGRRKMRDVPGSEFEIPADLVLIAMGFLGPEKNPLLDGFGVALDERGNVKVDDWQTSVESVFACGDARRGQSLVVWAIWEGRECARAVDAYLTGEARLPSTPQLL